MRCHRAIQVKCYWVPRREEVIQTRFTEKERTDVGLEKKRTDSKISGHVAGHWERAERWQFTQDSQGHYEDLGEKGTQEKRGVSETLKE